MNMMENRTYLLAAVAVGAIVLGGGGILLGRSMAPPSAAAAAPAEAEEEGHVEGQILMDEARAKGAGIITETGGLTSHSAILARAMEIPAVLSVPEACTKLAK